jgi:hypothetical protein
MAHVSNQMNVVGHQNKTPAKPIVTDRAVEKECNQAIECNVIVEHAPASLHANRQQVRNIAVTIRPTAMQSAQSAGRRFFGDSVRENAV